MFRLRSAGGNEGFNVQGLLILHIFVGGGASVLLLNRNFTKLLGCQLLEDPASGGNGRTAGGCENVLFMTDIP
jgi:hypothetical protein